MPFNITKTRSILTLQFKSASEGAAKRRNPDGALKKRIEKGNTNVDYYYKYNSLFMYSLNHLTVM